MRKALPVAALAAIFTLIGSITGFAGVTLGVVSFETQRLAGCSNSGQPGKNYLSGEEEPQVAVSSAGKMVAMFHQDRWSNGGAHGIGVSTSNDGVHWTPQGPLPDDMCVPGTDPSLSFYQRSSDPWVSFGPGGIGYASALSFNATNNFNAVAAGYSTDGGKTWKMRPIPGSVFTTSQNSTDKNATTADPHIAGVAYTVWDTLVLATDNPDDNPHAQAYTGPAYFSKTTDGGKTWSPAQIIVNTAERQQTIGNIIVVGPDGTLYDFTDLIISPNTPFRGVRGNAQVAFVKSTDGGASWSAPQIIAPFNSLGVHDPNTCQLLRVGDGLEEIAVDPSNGKLYVVWESSSNYDKNINQSACGWDDQIMLATSTDGGATWTGPTVIHKLTNGMPTYTPTVAVNGNKVAVTYYDNRNLGSQTNVLPTDYFVSISTNGGPWVEQQIYGDFDQLSAPYARGFFLGDYEGLQPSGTGFEAVFVATNCNGPDYTGPFCGTASSNLSLTPNTNPTDVHSAAVT